MPNSNSSSSTIPQTRFLCISTCPRTPNACSPLFNVHKHDMQVLSPTHPTSSSHRSCPSPHLLLRVKDGSTIRLIAFLWGRRELRLRSGRETMSPLLPSAPAPNSTPGEKPFELAPLPPFCKAKRTRKRSTCQSYPAPPIRRLTLVSSTSSPPCPRHAISSSSFRASPPASTPTPMSHVAVT